MSTYNFSYCLSFIVAVYVFGVRSYFIESIFLDGIGCEVANDTSLNVEQHIMRELNNIKVNPPSPYINVKSVYAKSNQFSNGDLWIKHLDFGQITAEYKVKSGNITFLNVIKDDIHNHNDTIEVQQVFIINSCIQDLIQKPICDADFNPSNYPHLSVLTHECWDRYFFVNIAENNEVKIEQVHCVDSTDKQPDLRVMRRLSSDNVTFAGVNDEKSDDNTVIFQQHMTISKAEYYGIWCGMLASLLVNVILVIVMVMVIKRCKVRNKKVEISGVELKAAQKIEVAHISNGKTGYEVVES
eukprot:295962_1